MRVQGDFVNNIPNWSVSNIQQKLENIEENFIDKKFVLIQPDLELRELGWVDRIIWSIVKCSRCFRERIFNLNNSTGAKTFYQMRKQFQESETVNEKIEESFKRIIAEFKKRQICEFNGKELLCSGLILETVEDDLCGTGSGFSHHIKAMLLKLKELVESEKLGADSLATLKVRSGRKSVVIEYSKEAEDYTTISSSSEDEFDEKIAPFDLNQSVNFLSRFFQDSELFTATFVDGATLKLYR